VEKILVTGAGGFIGSHLTETLIQKGYNVRAFIHYNSFNSYGWLDSCEPEIKKSLDVSASNVFCGLKGLNIMLSSIFEYFLKGAFPPYASS